MINEKGVIHQVRCNSTSSEAKKKFLVPKLNNFLRHVGH
jgi:hypothetical protein